MKLLDNSTLIINNREQKNHNLPLGILILIDFLAVCVVLVIFAFFHHVYPKIQEQKETLIITDNIDSSTDGLSQDLIFDETVVNDFQEQSIEESAEEPKESKKDDWKFASLTTDVVEKTDHSYSSHDIFIDISSYASSEGLIESPYTVADIYVRDVHCLQSYFAGGKFIATGHGENILNLMEESNAILASNGDYYSMQLQSGVLRNGILYRYPASNFDVFVLYEDGSVKIINHRTIKNKAEWDDVFKDAWQVWSFGPSLLDDDGKAYENLRSNIFASMANRNPRTGIGYYEPGHYCIVVVDGRADGSPGATIEEFASIFEELGCSQAYNLDGGGSSVIAFDGQVISHQSTNRKLPDIILVTEIEGSLAQNELNNMEK